MRGSRGGAYVWGAGDKSQIEHSGIFQNNASEVMEWMMLETFLLDVFCLISAL